MQATAGVVAAVGAEIRGIPPVLLASEQTSSVGRADSFAFEVGSGRSGTVHSSSVYF